MAIVTNIREFRGLIELSLDGTSWISIRKKHFAKLPLSCGDVIDPDHYSNRMSALQASDCYEAALTMLDQAAQASGDLRIKLVRKGYMQASADAAVDRLIENGLVDDQRYAERMVQSQLHKAAGVHAVRRRLRAKRLSEEAIESAMEEFDSEQQARACLEAAGKLWRKYSSLPSREARAKLSQALARRGFDWEAIRSAVESIISDDSDLFDD